MSRNIVVSFPGGRGNEIPLLYFSAKYYEDQGYEKVFVAHPIPGENRLDILLKHAERTLSCIDWTSYDHIVFTAKSLGTLVACQYKDKYQISASLILFTPLPDTLSYIHPKNNVLLVAAGDQDKYLDATTLKHHCNGQNIPCHIESGIGHRMEVMNDLPRNLDILKNVLHSLDNAR
ncbi:MAG: hypothetical protein II347_02195 [Lachnospiraceae bacterium]|nr:hypothetical protein [Lachnospiraceae bacterium]